MLEVTHIQEVPGFLLQQVDSVQIVFLKDKHLFCTFWVAQGVPTNFVTC